jgi:hypothetical protein
MSFAVTSICLFCIDVSSTLDSSDYDSDDEGSQQPSGSGTSHCLLYMFAYLITFCSFSNIPLSN